MTKYNAMNAFLKNKDGEWISPYTADTLKKNQITNCITEIPQRIKLELNNGVLTLKAGSVVTIPYGTEDLTATYPVGSTFTHENLKVVDTQYDGNKFFVWAEVQSDVITEQYSATAVNTRVVSLKLTQTDSTGSLLTYNAAHYSTANPTFTSSVQFYNTATNECWHTASNGTPDYQLSFPICIAKSNTSYVYASIEQVFNGMGYIGSTAWIDKGIKGLIPNGRNNDGTLNNIEFITPNLKVRTWVYESINQPLFYDVVADGTPSGGSYYVSETEPVSPTTNWTMWYNPQENIMRYSGDNGRWTVYNHWLFLGVYTSTDAASNNYKLTQFTSPKTVFKAVDYNEFNELASEVGTLQARYNATKAYITTTYVNGASWYRIWSDGWKEQGGGLHQTAGSGSGVVTISYLKAFSNANYTFVTNVGGNDDANISYYRMPYAKTATGFTYNKATGTMGSWYACGY